MIKTSKDTITEAKKAVEIDTKDHVLTCEVSNKTLKSYLFKKPDSGTFWMRAIQTNHGLHLEGDVGCLQICYKTFEWLANGDSTDYQMSKLDSDLHKQDVISPYLVKCMVQEMIKYKIDNRDSYKFRPYGDHSKQVKLFTDDEREFFQELKDYGYDPDWTINDFYSKVYDLNNGYCDDGLYITDYSWSTYYRFFCLKKVAEKVMEYEIKLEETMKVFDNITFDLTK